jgi:hypothetical protein
MTFTFKHYGTFTGPNSINGDYLYDTISQEGTWQNFLPNDPSFKLTDIAVVLYNNQADYCGMYVNGISCSTLNIAKNTGNLSLLNIMSSNTIFAGRTITNGNVLINGATIINGSLVVNGGISGPTITSIYAQIASKKSFDIPHPTKKNYRLRYICLEGPDAEVYIRGKLENKNIIELPEYWKKLVHEETIGVSLTPIGYHQELYVERIEDGTKIFIKNNKEENINCTYVVYGERKDCSKNISEYKGTSAENYPGNNNEYVINGGLRRNIFNITSLPSNK